MDSIRSSVQGWVTSPPALTAIVLLGAYVVARIVTTVLRAILVRVARRTTNVWDDRLVARLAGPASALITLQLFHVALDYIPLDDKSTKMLATAVTTLTVFIVIWAAFRAIDLARGGLEMRSWARDNPASRSLLALGARFAKVAVLILGTLVALSHLGVSIASLVAGLGIGGLVIALAAQKTVENLFGAVSIGIDQPMREGDYIRVYDIYGTVEKIGLRSTRVRTQDRTIVTIPNGELSNQRVENYAHRERIRLYCVIGLEYGTSATTTRAIITAFEQLLVNHPKTWKEQIVVRLVALGSSSLDIEVFAWFQTTTFDDFGKMRQDILLSFMEIVEKEGSALAFPTRTVHVVNDPPATNRLAPPAS